MEDQDLILIGAKHSTAGQFSREFTENQWLAAAREIQAAERERCARKPLTRDQIALVATYAPEGFTDGEVAEIVAKVELLHGIGA